MQLVSGGTSHQANENVPTVGAVWRQPGADYLAKRQPNTNLLQVVVTKSRIRARPWLLQEKTLLGQVATRKSANRCTLHIDAVVSVLAVLKFQDLISCMHACIGRRHAGCLDFAYVGYSYVCRGRNGCIIRKGTLQ